MTSTPLPLLPGDLAACCSPIAGGALEADAAERLARMFRALGDRHRVRLLSLIAASDGGATPSSRAQLAGRGPDLLGPSQ